MALSSSMCVCQGEGWTALVTWAYTRFYPRFVTLGKNSFVVPCSFVGEVEEKPSPCGRLVDSPAGSTLSKACMAREMQGPLYYLGALVHKDCLVVVLYTVVRRR
jgi:hypothetical protein